MKHFPQFETKDEFITLEVTITNRHICNWVQIMFFVHGWFKHLNAS